MATLSPETWRKGGHAMSYRRTLQEPGGVFGEVSDDKTGSGTTHAEQRLQNGTITVEPALSKAAWSMEYSPETW